MGIAISNSRGIFAIVALLVFGVSIVGYWAVFKRRGLGVVNLNLFTKTNYLFASIGQGLTNFILYSLLFAIPLFLIDMRDINHQVVSFLLFIIFVGSLVTTPIGGVLADRLGWRYPIVLGSIILLIGSVALTIVLQAPIILFLIPFVLIGTGIGLTGAARSVAALQDWPSTMAGSAAGTYSLSRYIGSIISTAIMAAVLGVSPTGRSFLIFFSILVVAALVNCFVGFPIRKLQHE